MKTFQVLFFLFFFQALSAQNDTTLSLQQTESLFLKNNLTVMAQQFNVEAAKAAVMQARLWENPTLTSEFNAYNPERNKYFDAGKFTEFIFRLNPIYIFYSYRNTVVFNLIKIQIKNILFIKFCNNNFR